MNTPNTDRSASLAVTRIDAERGKGYTWLVYSVFLFIQPVIEPSPRLWLGTLGVFAVFLAVFFAYLRTSSETVRRWMIAATFLMGLVTYPWNGGASTFFIYAAAFLPFSIASSRLVLVLFSAEVLGIAGEVRLLHMSWPNAGLAILLLLVIGGSNILFAEQRRGESKLAAVMEENVVLAAVAERERIARDLHDVLGHTLSVIVLKAELAKRLMYVDVERSAQQIADVELTARNALAEVREAIGGYRTQGLSAEIERARRTLDAAGVTLTWNPLPSNSPAPLPKEETVLCFLIREAVTNIVRHAEATQCAVRFTYDTDGFYALCVEDNGSHPIEREGNGLRGMRQRVASLGGRFSIRSDRGTSLLIELPVASTQRGGCSAVALPQEGLG